MTKKYYDPLSRILHWLMAIVIIYATMAGYLMHVVIDSNPRIFDFLSVMNMSMATLITPLFLLRWCWKHLRDPLPVEHETKIQRNQHKLAHMVHSLLYTLMFVVLSSGFLMLKNSYSLFWLYQIPNPVSSPEVNDFFFIVHRAGCILLATLVILHATAAFHHHLVAGNRTLYRMLGPATGR